MNTDIFIPFRGLFLIECHLYGTVLRRKLNRIGQEVQQNLIQAYTIAIDILSRNVMNEHIKMLLFCFHLWLYDTHDAVHDLPQGNLVHIEGHLPALDFGHIQHIVNQSKQMLAGKGNLFQTVLKLLGIVDVGCGNGGHSHNGIHWGADIVAHVREELTLRLVRMLRTLTRLFQCHHLLVHQTEILPEQQHQRGQNQSASAQDHPYPLAAQIGDHLTKLAIGHDHHQIPFGIGQRGAIDMTTIASDLEHIGINLVFRHRFLQLGQICFGIRAADR